MTVNRLIILFGIIFLMIGGGVNAQKQGSADKRTSSKAVSFPRTDTFLLQLLQRYPDYFDTLLRNPERRIQIIYTKIDRRKNNQPLLTHFYYQLDGGNYFYPASTVKLPAAILALQRLNELNRRDVDRNTTMITGAAGPGQTSVYNDPSAADGRPSIAHYIKKILLVSDNDAFNRLYEFLGQDYLNKTLHRMGYDSVQLVHRLSVLLSQTENRRTNPVRFYDTSGKLLYAQPQAVSDLPYHQRSHFLGTGYYKGGDLVREPFDFSAKNRMGLKDLHTILQAVLFPASVERKKRFRLTEEDKKFLYRYLSLSPRQSDDPRYDSSYNDTYVKFLFYGGTGAAQPGIHIFNKVGNAYGFLTDAAYFIDTNNGIEFMLSATIHCNSDGIYNDDKYDYETVGYPFMKNLGKVIYEYERNRSRATKPSFENFIRL